MIARMSTRTLVLLPGMDGSDKLFGPLQAAAPAGTETVAVGYPPGRLGGARRLHEPRGRRPLSRATP